MVVAAKQAGSLPDEVGPPPRSQLERQTEEKGRIGMKSYQSVRRGYLHAGNRTAPGSATARDQSLLIIWMTLS
jgi:hypothetical protein